MKILFSIKKILQKYQFDPQKTKLSRCEGFSLKIQIKSNQIIKFLNKNQPQGLFNSVFQCKIKTDTFFVFIFYLNFVRYIIFSQIIETMEKQKIQRRDHARDYSVNNIKLKSVRLATIDPSEPLNLSQISNQQKKTGKLIQPPQKRKITVSFQKQNTILSQLDAPQVEINSSAHGLKQKSTRKALQMGKTRSINQQVNLKNLVSNYRFSNLKKHMFNKLRKNSVFRKPITFQPFTQNVNEDDLWKGIEIPKTFLNLAFCIGIAQTFFACFLTTLLFTFNENLYEEYFFRCFEIFSLLCLICEIAMGFIRVKQVGSRKLTKIKQISSNYLHFVFFLDLLCLLGILICLTVPNYRVHYMLALFFLKVPQCIQKLVKIETKLFESFYWQQYWGLMKILLSNFLYAHFIAILIMMMSWLDDHQSWLNIKNIVHAPWYEQYSWAYYWGTTVMLTVGFGDLSAANFKEAICLVLIQTVSCMALAYNINCIGNLLRDLRSNQIEKQKSLKVLKKLCDKNQINRDLDFKLCNHVKQTYNIETRYNFEQQSEFIKKLPINLRQDFLRSANQKILSNLTFIRNFTHRTILALAQKIQMKIAHPNQLLYGANQISKIIILKQGEIGLFPTHSLEKYSKIVIDKFMVKQSQPSTLISLDFLNLPIVRNYDVKSIVYSQVYLMETETMLQILKRKNVDIEFFHSMKDKQKIQLDDFQILKCANCSRRHTKFRCPRLHYMPIVQQVIFKHLYNIKIHKNIRYSFVRSKFRLNCLKSFKNMQGISNQNNLIQEQGPYDICITSDPDNRQSAHSIHIGINRASSHFSSLMINQLSAMSEKQKKRSFISKSSNRDIRTKLILSAAELVQKEMMDYLNERDKEFWNVESDEAKDYQFYFARHNPKCLEDMNIMKKIPSISKSKSCSNSKSKMRCLLRKNS